jgi:hypothetical protein
MLRHNAQNLSICELVRVRLTEILMRNDMLGFRPGYRQPRASLGACR